MLGFFHRRSIPSPQTPQFVRIFSLILEIFSTTPPFLWFGLKMVDFCEFSKPVPWRYLKIYALLFVVRWSVLEAFIWLYLVDLRAYGVFNPRNGIHLQPQVFSFSDFAARLHFFFVSSLPFFEINFSARFWNQKVFVFLWRFRIAGRDDFVYIL